MKMNEKFRKIGAAIGSTLMLGTTLAGAAFAGDVSKFYTNYAVGTDGSVSSVLVIGSNAAAADVVSAIGIAAEIGQKALKETAGAGSVDLAVASTTTDGKILEGTLGSNQNSVVARTSAELLLKPTGEGTNTLSTLSTGTVSASKVSGGSNDNVKYVESLKVAKLDKMIPAYVNDNTVTANSDNTNGYDDTVIEVTEAGWLVYNVTFDDQVETQDLVDNAAEIQFMGQKYIVASGTTVGNSTVTTMKLAGAGVSKTVGAGEEIEFSGAKVKLSMVQKGTSVNKAIIEVTSATGTVETKSITVGDSATVGGVSIYVSSAGEAYAAGTQTASASLILGGEAIELKNGDYYPKSTTDWKVDITPGSTAGFVKAIALTYQGTLQDKNAIGVGQEKSFLNDLVKVKYLGQKIGATKPLTVTMSTLDVDTNSATADKVAIIKFPGELSTQPSDLNVDKKDEAYLVIATTGTKFASGQVVYRTSNDTPEYKNLTTAPMKAFNLLLDTATYTLNSTASSLRITEPSTGTQYANVSTYVVNFDTTQSTPKVYNITVSPNVANSNGLVAWVDSNNAFKYKSGFVDSYGASLKAASQSEIAFNLPTEEAKTQLQIGSSKATDETASVAVGSSAKLGGVSVKVVSAGATGKMAAGVPLGVAKLDSELTSADKSAYNVVLVGGPVANSVVNDLVASGKLAEKITNDSPGKGKGKVVVIDDAFVAGKVAVVVAGSDRSGTRAAAQLLQQLASNPSLASGASVTVQFTGAGSAPTVVS